MAIASSTATGRSRPTSKGDFSFRAHDMITKCHADGGDVASWSPDGLQFTIQDPEQLRVRYFLDHHFTHDRNPIQFSSFYRQLNHYGFSGRRHGKAVTFSHPYFLRDNRDACKNIGLLRTGGVARTNNAVSAAAATTTPAVATPVLSAASAETAQFVHIPREKFEALVSRVAALEQKLNALYAEKASKDAAEQAKKEAEAIMHAAERSKADAAENAIKDATARAIKEAAEKAIRDVTEKALKDVAATIPPVSPTPSPPVEEPMEVSGSSRLESVEVSGSSRLESVDAEDEELRTGEDLPRKRRRTSFAKRASITLATLQKPSTVDAITETFLEAERAVDVDMINASNGPSSNGSTRRWSRKLSFGIKGGDDFFERFLHKLVDEEGDDLLEQEELQSYLSTASEDQQQGSSSVPITSM